MTFLTQVAVAVIYVNNYWQFVNKLSSVNKKSIILMRLTDKINATERHHPKTSDSAIRV